MNEGMDWWINVPTHFNDKNRKGKQRRQNGTPKIYVSDRLNFTLLLNLSNESRAFNNFQKFIWGGRSSDKFDPNALRHTVQTGGGDGWMVNDFTL
jgi:hypothetical protein